jgi:geranylgeranyl diphosphate synthase type I
MDWLQSLYPVVRDVLWQAVPEYWPELSVPMEGLTKGPLIPEVVLPLASCRAVGGQAIDAAHVSAALVAAATSLRVLDDLADRDRPDRLWNQIGASRAWNYAFALQTLSFDILAKAPLAPELYAEINDAFIDTFLHIAYGQERDLAGNTHTIEAYWATVEQKIARGYATGCAVGAILGTDKVEWIQACSAFGLHLGFALQVLNDLLSIWRPDGVTDLGQGKVTLPLIYGLTSDHPGRDELDALVKSGEVASHGARIKEILDAIDTKDFVIWAALKERDQALEAIGVCPDSEGRGALEAYITGMFGDVEPLMPGPS